jgi:site-specific DNA recombinase
MTAVLARQRVVLYARVSTEQQGTEEHFSIDAQLAEMRDFVARKGWTIAAEFIEMLSGTIREHPQLEALLEMVTHGGCDLVLVHELSRLSRSVYHTLDIFETLGKANVGFASVKDPDFDFADPSKRFFLIMMSAINEYYINLLRLHTSKAKRQRAREGLYNMSIIPFGYARTGDPQKPPVLVPEEAPAMELAFRQYSTGQFSDQQIAEQLTDAGYLNRKSHRFTKDVIAAILRNPFYIGKILYNRDGDTEIFDGQHTPLIPQEIWDKCQAIRASRYTSGRALSKNYRIYLLSNLAHCDVCGRKLRSQGTQSGLYYREVSYLRGYTDCPHQNVGVRTSTIDREVAAIISALKLAPDWQQALEARLQDDAEAVRLHHKRESLEAERRRLKEMNMRGDFDEDAEFYQSELARIRRELAALPTYEQLETLKSAVETIKTLGEIWPEAEPVEQRDILRLILREARVDVAHGHVMGLVPDAAFIPMFREIPLLQERDFGTFVPVWSSEQAETVLSLPQLEPLTTLPEESYALPFVAVSPLSHSDDTRIAPALSHALTACRESGGHPLRLVQAISGEYHPIPADLRKRAGTRGETLPLDEVLRRPAESIDILATDQALALQPEDAPPEQRVYPVLRPHAIWYLSELPLADMPAHWVFAFFPELWELARTRELNLHKLYERLQGAGFKCEVKRHLYFQPVPLGMALRIAGSRPGPLAQLEEAAFQQGMTRLKQAVKEQGANHLLGSEMALAEIWAQKIVKPGKTQEK